MGTAFFGLTFSSCAPLPVYKTDLTIHKVEVPLSSFAESDLLIVRDMQVDYDILLVKKSDADFNALYMRCTHRDNPLSATRNGLFCNAHGSSFDLDGNVKKAPATEPLEKFKTEVRKDKLIITLNT